MKKLEKLNLETTLHPELQAMAGLVSPSSETKPARKVSLNPTLGEPHISRDPSRGYIEYDPHIEIRRHGVIREVLPGQHGLMDVRAEIGVALYEAGMLFTPFARKILEHK